MQYTFGTLLALAALAGSMPQAQAATEKLPPGARVAKLEVRPDRIHLTTPFTYSQLVLTAQLATGERIDATRMASLEAPALVKINTQGVVRPQSDGDAFLGVV